MTHLPESVQVLFVAGEEPDFRIAPRADLRQQLRDGGLPIVVTSWDAPDRIFQFRETSFVRQIGDAIEPVRGDENAAGFLRLQIVNVSGKDQTATIRLCVNRSSNGQPRGVAAMEYSTALTRDGDSLRTPEGKVRLLWKVPEGTKVDTSLRDYVPKLLVWDQPDSVPRAGLPREKAFNRYFASKVNEDHSGFKAIDHQMMTYWTPEAPIGPKGLSIGLEFPQPRSIRQFAVRYEGDASPAIDGYRLEYHDGSVWKTIADRLGGKTRQEIMASAEVRKTLGSHWIHTFEPVETRCLRLVITSMPQGRDKPAIAEIDHQYRFTTANSPWIDTAAGDYLGNVMKKRGADWRPLFTACTEHNS